MFMVTLIAYNCGIYNTESGKNPLLKWNIEV